jgi:mono/diheme cytochrome c family protein
VATPSPRSGPDDARGGRLYDNWRAEKHLTDSFVPDVSSSPELDGQGGPNANGTLNDGHGQPLPNTGHEYRLKNLFGWDLRGAEGIYGSRFQQKPFVLTRNLLTDARSAEELRAWLAEGDETTPAYGQVLNEADIEDLVAYLIKTRSGELARPSSIFALDERSPKHYVLAAGGDAERGRERYAISCADCHGEDGRSMVIDETESLGTMSRSSAYEVWFKMLNGQPGTDMRRQILVQSGEDQARAILDVLAALCDRTQFPAIGGGADVPDTDPRCASYLR